MPAPAWPVVSGLEAAATDFSAMMAPIARVRLQPHEVWMVKLADRIVNLSHPPYYWSEDKARAYRAEAQGIHDALASAHDGLAERLRVKIERYRRFTGE